MAIKIGINGFGRIGRLVARAAMERKGEFDLVAVNDITNAATLGHLFKYDSVHGNLPHEVQVDGDTINVGGDSFKVLAERDPANLPWGDLGVDYVVESTGLFRKKADASKHITGGAKKVIISAPATDEDITIVLGVNCDNYDAAKHHVVSNASCTTNCLAPPCSVIKKEFGIEKGLMTTIHAYTSDQRIQDAPHKDLRRSRAAALSMIPTTTGAAKAIALVIPELKGKLDGFAIRVPTPNVSVVDLTAQLSKNTTVEEVNAALTAAAAGPLKGIMSVTTAPLVSIDFNHCAYSSNVDAPFTKVIDGNLLKLLAWYDNEWAYSVRVVDLIKLMEGRK